MGWGSGGTASRWMKIVFAPIAMEKVEEEEEEECKPRR